MFRNRRIYAVLFFMVILAFAIGITIQGAAQRKDGSSSSTATDNVQFTGVNCTYSLAYWAAHPERYPAYIVIGDQRYRRDQMASILASADPGQELLRQVVVAFLNSTVDGGQPSIDGELLEAYQWLVDHPVGAAVVELDRQDSLRLVSLLEQYNQGQAGLAACESPGAPTFALTPTATGTPTPTPTFIPTPTSTATLAPPLTPTRTASPTSAGTPTLTATTFSTPNGTSTSSGTPTLTAEPTATPTALVTYAGATSTPTPTRVKTVRVTTQIIPATTTPVPPTTVTPTPRSTTPITPTKTHGITPPTPTVTKVITPTPSATKVPALHGVINPQSSVPTLTEAFAYTPTVTETPPGQAFITDSVTACPPASPLNLVRILIVYIRVLERLGFQPKGR